MSCWSHIQLLGNLSLPARKSTNSIMIMKTDGLHVTQMPISTLDEAKLLPFVFFVLLFVAPSAGDTTSVRIPAHSPVAKARVAGLRAVGCL